MHVIMDACRTYVDLEHLVDVYTVKISYHCVIKLITNMVIGHPNCFKLAYEMESVISGCCCAGACVRQCWLYPA